MGQGIVSAHANHGISGVEIAPPPCPSSRASRAQNLSFLGPFLADSEGNVWFPTPKDLIAVRQQRPEDQEPNPSHKKAAADWDELVRLQPCRQDSDTWAHLCFSHPVLRPMVPPPLAPGQYICGKPKSWMKGQALLRYLKGEDKYEPSDFGEDPWQVQILPHIHMQPEQRQVKESDGYFTEVAIRLAPGWHFVAAMSSPLDTTVVRLGGEGHRILITKMKDPEIPPDWQVLEAFSSNPENTARSAYLLTPGLARTQSDAPVYGVYPYHWADHLSGCATDKAQLWGGISTIERAASKHKGANGKRKTEFALLPQRAFVPPGTVYAFGSLPDNLRLLPRTEPHPWTSTFNQLNYGKLLWVRGN